MAAPSPSSRPSPLPTKLGTRPWAPQSLRLRVPRASYTFSRPSLASILRPSTSQMPRPRERNEATTPLPTAVPCVRGGGTTACLGCLRASSTIVPVPLLASHAPLCARPALVLFFPFRPVVAPHLLFSPPLRTRRTAARTRYPAPLPQHPSRTRRIPYTGITVLFFPSAFPALARPSLCSPQPCPLISRG